MINPDSNQKVTPSHLKKHNEALILREIYAHKTISRVKLAQLTHLSRPSVTELTQSLKEKGLITDIGPEQVLDKVGKKPTLLALNPDAYQIIGVVLTDTHAVGSLLNLRMKVLEQQSVPLNGTKSDDLIQLIMDLIQNVAVKATSPLLGIAIGTPGIVDSQTGIVHLTAIFDWKELPLAQLLSKKLNHLPVYIGNDSNFAAVGEYRFGLAQGIKDLVVVEVADGIGVGILADGHMVQGSAYAAGELGHTPFLPLDDVCICGRRGCLETIVSWWGIKRHVQRLIRAYPESTLAQVVGGKPITIAGIQQAIILGDPYIIDLVETAAAYLGRALVMVAHLLNPKCIVITGSIIELGDTFIDRVRQTTYEHTLPYIASQMEIIANRLDDRSILLGAGAFLLEQELGL